MGRARHALLLANKAVKWGTVFAAALSILWTRDALVAFAVAGAVATAVAAKSLKLVLKEARPSGMKKTAGMPSSHSSVLFFFAVYLSPRVPPVWGGATLAIAAGTAWSRVFLRYHTWAQVIVGALLGSGVALLWSNLALVVFGET